MEALSLDVGGIVLGRDDVGGGQCLGGALPVCGVWFRDGELQGFVNQYEFPETASGAGFRLRLQNTSGDLEGWSDPRPHFQSIGVDDLGRGFNVASGFVRFSRIERADGAPAPEPGGALLFAAGMLVAACASRR